MKPAPRIISCSTMSMPRNRRTPKVWATVVTDRGTRHAYGHTAREALNRAAWKAR